MLLIDGHRLKAAQDARQGARVIFRTAAPHSPLEAKLDAAILDRWDYDRETSLRLGANDRSAIYGGFHIYRSRR